MNAWCVFALGLAAGAVALAIVSALSSLRLARLLNASRDLVLAMSELVNEANETANHYAMVAQGINHDRECRNDFTNGDPGARVCLRCECEQLRGENERLQAEADMWMKEAARANDTRDDALNIAEALRAQLSRTTGRVVPPDWHGPAEDF